MLTMKEIAEKSGFSRYTVSKVLQNNPTVRKKTRDEVLAVCRKFGYVPNINAISLVKGQTDFLGVLVPQISDPVYSEMLRLMELAARARKMHLFICSSFNDCDKESENIKVLLGLKVRAMLVTPVAGPPDLSAHRAASKQTPLIYLERRITKNAYYIGSDFADGTYRMTNLLREQGCKTIAYMDSCLSSPGYVQSLQLAGYRQSIHDAGEKEHLIRHDFTYQEVDNARAGYDIMYHQIYIGEIPDALICATDQMAIGAMRAIRENGLVPGRDILVAGHNNMDMDASQMPSLTSISRNIMQNVKLAFNLLDQLLDGKAPSEKDYVLPLTIFERESTLSRKTGDGEFLSIGASNGRSLSL